ncbi:hypothetical protein DBZ36_07950 [Alginatibacterium sediminis]|uniref:Protein BatD n=1 Tax=Alginatibacterium sediminis TaxID=2164068 RepID=A0A420EI25_9ALTE|nr:BatD family protein [Alginatibacterium sediminis]RKF20362.1 hypothetical protein DBZ36_07950 [Alginatibacterium sediminis]
MIKLLVNKFILLLIMSLPFLSASALTISDLVNNESIIASSYVDIKDPISIGGEVTLTIDISTDTQFAQGTLIKHFDLPNAIVLKQGPFAINSVLHKNGKQYVNQLWQIPIYPQQGGDYVIPPIVIEVGVKHGDEVISGKLLSETINFSAFVPSPYMTDENHWLVAENAKLSEKVVTTIVNQTDSSDVKDQQSEPQLSSKQLHVGDSIEREITLSANGSLAMLFPSLIETGDYQSSGARVYISPSEYNDKESRGVRTSNHIEKVTLIADKPGEIVLPTVELIWWDIKKEREERLQLEAQRWQVKHTFVSFVTMYWHWLLALLLAIITLAYISYRLWLEFKHRKATGTLPLWYQFRVALKQNQKGQAESLIYRKMMLKHNRLTLLDPSQDDLFKEKALSLQQIRYQKASSHSVKRSLLRSLWDKIR